MRRGHLLCAVLVGLAALAALAGCGSGGGDAGASPAPSRSTGEIGIPPGETGSPSQPPGKRPMKITLTRTGGIAGIDQRIVIEPGGAWTYTDADGPDETGQLTDQQVSKLQSLAMDERLPREAKHKDTRKCADGYFYELRAGTFTMGAVECGRFEARPAFTALVDHVKEHTAM